MAILCVEGDKAVVEAAGEGGVVIVDGLRLEEFPTVCWALVWENDAACD